jgi:ABC-type transport system substrate-binding protein
MSLSRRRFLATAPLAPLAAARTAAAQSRSAGPKTLRVAFPTAETGFDPAQVQDLYSRTVLSHILDAPLEYDYLARPARLRPNTAVAAPEVSADYRKFTIRLRPGIFFADDPAFKGARRELTAHDYVYSFKRLYDPRWKSPMLFALENSKLLGLSELRQQAIRSKKPFDYDREVEGLRALDRYTFQIRLAESDPRFVHNLADASLLGAVAREVVEAYGDAIMAHPVGTGPFRLAHWTRSARIVLERNPDYREERYDFEPAADAAGMRDEVARLRGRRLPLVDRVEISIVAEDQPRWLAFQQGELDLLAVPGEFVPIAAPNGRLAPFLERRGVKLRRTAAADVALTYFNMEHPVVGGYTPDRIALRRAIALAFDGDEYIRIVFAGMGVRAQSPIVPGTFGYDPDYASEMGEFSRARAAALLDMFGYVDRDGDGWRELPDGSPLVLELASSPTQLDRKRNELWKRYMSAVGLRIDFRVAQWAELLRMSLAGRLMMWGYVWQVGGPDSDILFGMGYGPNKEQLNDARFDLPEYNALYERQRVLPDGPERLRLLHRAARVLTAYMPYKFHLHRVVLDLAQPWVDGHRRHPFTTRQWNWIDVDPVRREAMR